MRPKSVIKVGEGEVEIFEHTVYLRRTISFENYAGKEIHRRVEKF